MKPWIEPDFDFGKDWIINDKPKRSNMEEDELVREEEERIPGEENEEVIPPRDNLNEGEQSESEIGRRGREESDDNRQRRRDEDVVLDIEEFDEERGLYKTRWEDGSITWEPEASFMDDDGTVEEHFREIILQGKVRRASRSLRERTRGADMSSSD